MWVLSKAGPRRTGAAGSLAIAVGGLAAGSLPAREPWGLWVPYGHGVTVAAAVLAYLGLTLLVLAWWEYGRELAAGETAEVAGQGGVRDVLVTLGWWAAPLVLAPPLYSADVYSYIAQGAMVLEGHDVYAHGPSVLGPGSLGADAAASVGGNWTDTPAPYGPVFLLLAKGVTWATGGTIVPAVIGLRLTAVGALVLTAWAVRRLAAQYGAGESRALWLAVLNPLLLIHVVGGMHNDGLMIGLMLAGVVCALRGRWVLGSAVVALAMTIKSPAAVALLFIGVIVVRDAGRGPAVLRAVKGALGPGLVAATIAAATTWLSGTGFGWLRTQSVAATVHTPLSLTSDLGLAAGYAARLLSGDVDPAAVKSLTQTLGLAAAVAVIAVLAYRSLRGRMRPVRGLGLALLALVALSPMVQPWYLLWGTVAVAAISVGNDRIVPILMVLSVSFVYETQPSGHTPAYGFALAALAVAAAVTALRRHGGPAAAEGPAPSRPRPEPDSLSGVPR
ncbi:polyprenol phosphomannose-dependent alpha 1,6 mannosyltransferase MptB [Streptomyces sp. NPDC059909]|uniref:polyprenol phosphomannose-dependent alpha 1,6 mannosyltransferase MptB n=1 Tax=Streptomyces sp. NPDC059909 TaxID=3346998 RepID=UPI0036509233